MSAGGRVTVRLEKTLGELSFDVALNGIEKRERGRERNDEARDNRDRDTDQICGF